MQGEAPQKYIRTYARDMATVQKGGTPDLVPLGSAAPALDATAAPRPAAPPPAAAVVTTYDKGLQEAAGRLQEQVAKSPAAVSWEKNAAERGAVLARLEEKARAQQYPTSPVPAQAPAPHVEIHAATPPAVLVAPPAGALSVPAYAPTFTLGIPGEPVPESQPVPPAPLAPSPPPAAAPVFAPPAPPREAPPPVPDTLHTYATDFSERVGESNASRAAILAAEADARPVTPVAAPAPRRSRGGARAAISIALVLVGVALVYVAYARFVANTGPVTLALAPSAPIFVDERETVSGSGAALVQAIEQANGRPLADGSIRLLYNPAATSTSVFNALGLAAPDVLLRNISAAGSMAGIASENGEQSPFFILSVSSYGDTFAGMLAWEPSMVNALGAFYPPRVAAAPAAATTTAASSTPGALNTPALSAVEQGFSDEVVANHDARVYRDSENRTILIYGYWDQQTLVITRDEATFGAILSRLANSRSTSS